MPHIFAISNQTHTFKPVGIHIINDAIPIPYCLSHSHNPSVPYFYAEQNVTKNNNTLETSRITIFDNIVLFFISPNICTPWTLKATIYFSFKIMEFNSTHLLPIPINKQDMDRIQITQSKKLWYIIIYSLTRNTSKVRHIKIKLTMIIRIPLISPCQGYKFSFKNKTIIKYQTYHLH